MNIQTEILSLNEEDLKRAGRLLSEGKLVAFPTETVYGLGADGLNEDAVRGIYKAKNRPQDNPIILHIAKKDMVYELCQDVSESAQKLMDVFWPGPLTIIMKSKDNVPSITRGGLDTVAIRMPKSDVARKIIEFAKTPIAAPSANISGRPSPTNAIDVKEDMMGRIDGIVFGEDCQYGIESTVVLATEDKVKILRPGYITENDIKSVIGHGLQDSDTKEDNKEKPLSPGMKYKHYAPKAKMFLYLGEESKVLGKIEEDRKKFEKNGLKVAIINENIDDLDKVAKNFFASLRELDRKEVDIILARGVENQGLGKAIMNRMIKSSGHNVIRVD